jgi:pilus assembly protein Flp/PilA
MRRLTMFRDRGQVLVLRMQYWCMRTRDDERGQGLVEYALILALIAILVIIALKFLQPQISNTLNKVSNNL